MAVAPRNSLEINTDSIGINLNRNLSKLMKNNHISLSMLYRNTGIAIPTIKRLQNDPTTNPTITTLVPIANFFGITVSQLIGNESLPTNLTGYIENKIHWLKVPLIEWNQVVDWQISEKRVQANSFILVDIDVGQDPFAVRVEEDDWSTVSKESILIINTELTPTHKDYAIVCKNGQNKSTLKQVILDEGKIYLKSMNPCLPTTLFEKGHCFLGVLMQIRKNTKT